MNKQGYVVDKNTPGKWITAAQAGMKSNKDLDMFATKEEAQKYAGNKKVVFKWTPDSDQTKGYWGFENAAVGQQENPKVAPMPSSGSNYYNGRTSKFNVDKGTYFKMYPGAYVYAVQKTSKGYTIQYGDDDMQSGVFGEQTMKATGKVVKAEPGLEQQSSTAVSYYQDNGGPDGKGTWVTPGLYPPAMKFARGGLVPRGYAEGGPVYGTDTIPAMLTPGEFVMTKSTVDRIGASNLSEMNSGTSMGDSVYNYSITVNANSSDANGIADAVLREVKRIDSQRIRSSNI